MGAPLHSLVILTLIDLRMGEKSDREDEPLEDLNSTGLENIAGKIVPPNESAAISTNPENDNMEIHHSHHHDPPAHTEKPWKHYLFEFLMLFLAVTLGFLVENLREHYIEQKRAKVYAKSMIINLERDTSELIQIIERTSLAVNYLDTFLSLVSVDTIQKIPAGKLYWYGLWGGYIRGFQSNDATFQQMKSSGSLRYFTNLQLEQNISDYDQLLRAIYMLNQIDQPVFIETRKARAKLFDFRYNNAANKIVQESGYRNISQEAINAFVKTSPSLLSNDKILFNEYIELCRSRNLRQELQNFKSALLLASTIIVQLREEYHLE